jgi:hypothetical protein
MIGYFIAEIGDKTGYLVVTSPNYVKSQTDGNLRKPAIHNFDRAFNDFYAEMWQGITLHEEYKWHLSQFLEVGVP